MIPQATYRIQLSPKFTFSDLKQISSYLKELGISHIYASPILKPVTGSMHGYDVTDPTRLNPELGNETAFRELMEILQSDQIGWIQDIVPNHMAFHSENEWLKDIFEQGSDSCYYDFFDINWNHPYESLKGKVLAPFLGKFYADALEEGELKLVYDEQGLGISYYDLRYPFLIRCWYKFFEHQIELLEQKLGSGNPVFIRYFAAVHFLKTTVSMENSSSVYEQLKLTKKMLWDLYQDQPDIKTFIHENLEFFNGSPGIPKSYNPLDQLLSEQIFRLSFWKFASEEINYRRFFNINGLISLKAENEAVFNISHDLILKYIHKDWIQGLRVDHIDGLFDPTEYLNRLRNKTGKKCYIVVEKILSTHEKMPLFWPIQGSSGYDFLNAMNGIFVKTENEEEFDRIYTRFSGISLSMEEMIPEKKKLIMGKYMAGDIDNLAQYIKKISGTDRRGRDITLYGLKRALVETSSWFPIYRTYISHENFTQEDRTVITQAVDIARKRNPWLLYELNFIEKFLMLKYEPVLSEEEKKEWRFFVMKFQQFCGPLMAKGVEDTLFYIYNRFTSLNEVGGAPQFFGLPLKNFHAFIWDRKTSHPYTLNTSATHDTKRGEDVRARLNVLSEIPQEWAEHCRNWTQINRKHKIQTADEQWLPDDNDEYLLYQTLIGTFPFGNVISDNFISRITEYMVKALREAKIHTNWLRPDDIYETAFSDFIHEILTPGEDNPFFSDFLNFKNKIEFYGIFNSLSQILIKTCAPGIPDFYQGNELWDLNLVDPDNRRPVDFTYRKRSLDEIKINFKTDANAAIFSWLKQPENGKIKLFLTNKLLTLRRDYSELFEKGGYEPLVFENTFSGNLAGFVRRYENKWAMALFPRFLTEVVKERDLPLGCEVWKDTTLLLPEGAPHKWRNSITQAILTGEKNLFAGQILERFPCALLINESE